MTKLQLLQYQAGTFHGDKIQESQLTVRAASCGSNQVTFQVPSLFTASSLGISKFGGIESNEEAVSRIRFY